MAIMIATITGDRKTGKTTALATILAFSALEPKTIGATAANQAQLDVLYAAVTDKLKTLDILDSAKQYEIKTKTGSTIDFFIADEDHIKGKFYDELYIDNANYTDIRHLIPVSEVIWETNQKVRY